MNAGLLEKLFALRASGSTVRRELLAGLTTFLTMSYIIAVNPGILSAGDGGIPFTGALTATILVSAVSCILMGLLANLPYAIAPGMGINAYFAYTVVMGMGVSWQAALAATFISGVVFLLMSLGNLREMIVEVIPLSIRHGMAVGIGLFLALIGLKDAGFIIDNPATLVSFGGFTPQVILFLAGMVLSGALLLHGVRGALLIGIVAVSLLALLWHHLFGGAPLVTAPEQLLAHPDFHSAFFQLDLSGLLHIPMLAVIFTLLFTDLFDSVPTLIGVAQVAGLEKRDGTPLRLHQALRVDALSSTLSGLFGSSAGTAYIESATGVREGGRTGLTAVMVGLLFLPFLWLAPVIEMVPPFATAPAVVLVGYFMMAPVKRIDMDQPEEALPAFLAMVLIPLTFSITQGVCWSLLFYSLMKLLMGRWREIPALLWVINGFAALALALI